MIDFMEENKKELECLKETIELMEKTQKSMSNCSTVTDMEYKIHGLYLEELKDRAMDLEIDINGCILQEV